MSKRRLRSYYKEDKATKQARFHRSWKDQEQFNLLQALCSSVPALTYNLFCSLPLSDQFSLCLSETFLRDFLREKDKNFYSRFSFKMIETAPTTQLCSYFIDPTMTDKQRRELALSACKLGRTNLLQALLEFFDVNVSFKTYNFFKHAGNNDIRRILLEWRGSYNEVVHVKFTQGWCYGDETVNLLLLKRADEKEFKMFNRSAIGFFHHAGVARFLFEKDPELIGHKYAAISYKAAFFCGDLDLMRQVSDRWRPNINSLSVENMHRHGVKNKNFELLDLLHSHYVISRSIRETAFKTAITDNDVVLARWLSPKDLIGETFSFYGMKSEYPLVFAVKKGYREMFDLLLEFPMSAKILTNAACTAASFNQKKMLNDIMQHADFDISHTDNKFLKEAITHTNLELVKQILRDPKFRLYDCGSRCIFEVVSDVEILKYLLADERMAFATCRTYSFRHMIYYGQVECVKYLLENNLVDPAENDNEPLQVAIRQHKTDIIYILLAHPAVDPTSNGNALLRHFLHRGDKEQVKKVMQHPKIIKFFNDL